MNMKRLTILCVVATSIVTSGCVQKNNSGQSVTSKSSQPAWGDDNYLNGVMAWRHQDHKNAARFFLEAYDEDDARAEAMLGVLYVKGAGAFKSAEVGRGYAIAADQRPDFDAYRFYHQQWQTAQDPDLAYLIAWILANRFSGQAKQDYREWITRAAQAGQADARYEVAKYLN